MTRAEHALFIKGLEAARRMLGRHATSFAWNPATQKHDRLQTADVFALDSALMKRIRSERKKARRG